MEIKTSFQISKKYEEEYVNLKIAKKILKQPKDSTAFKTLAEIGTNVLQDSLTGKIINTMFGNERRNQRIGVSDSEFKD